jgi:hypothetical protein
MNIVNNKKMDFRFIQGLFDLGFDYGKGWKSHYFREAQSCFEKHFTPLINGDKIQMTQQNTVILMMIICGHGLIELIPTQIVVYRYIIGL